MLFWPELYTSFYAPNGTDSAYFAVPEVPASFFRRIFVSRSVLGQQEQMD